MSAIICCGCDEFYGTPKREACARQMGTWASCPCDCHACTHVMVSLNRAEIQEALIRTGIFFHRSTLAVLVNRLCKRWEIDR